MDVMQWIKDHTKQVAIVIVVVIAGVVIYIYRDKIAAWVDSAKKKLSGEGY